MLAKVSVIFLLHFLPQAQGPTHSVTIWRCARCYFKQGYTWRQLI